MKEREDRLEVENLKESLIYHTLLLGGILGFIAFIVSLAGWDRPEMKYGFFIDFAIIVLFFTTLFFHRKINLRNKVIIIISGIFVLVINDLYQFGVYSDSVILLIIIPIFVFFGFGKNKTIIAFVLFTIIYFLFTFLYLSGSLISQVDLTVRSLSFDIWVIKFLFIAIAATVSFIVIKRFVEIYIMLIEEQKQQNQILSESKKQVEMNSANVTAIIEGATESIWAFNRNYEILYLNQLFKDEFYQTFGVILEPGSSLVDSLPKELKPFWKPRYDRVLANEQFFVEDEVPSGDDTIYIQVTFNPIVSDGRVIGGSCFGSNITLRKKAEKELYRAKEKAEESDRLKSAFLANMSHEIRTPMNGILGFADLLSTPGLDTQKHNKYVDIIKRSGSRMLNIISDIIDISKIESGQMSVQITDFNVNEILDQIYKILRLDAMEKELDLTCIEGLTGNAGVILSDKDKIYSILSNLVKNAIKYTDKGTVEFGYVLKEQNKDQILEFYVKDTGIGIPENRQEAIFERFVQADIEDTQARQGAGLGLAISKSLVEILGGDMWLISEEGKGSEFYFSIRYTRANGDEKTDRTEMTKQSQNMSPHSGSPKLKILIVEDDEPSEMYLSIELEEYTRELIVARSGLAAVEACRENTDIDLIFMDIRLPEMNGYEATSIIRDFNKDVIIIAQTAYGMQGDREKALTAGCNDYISKPINSKDLMALVMKYYGNLFSNE